MSCKNQNISHYYSNILCDDIAVNNNSFPDAFNTYMFSEIEQVQPLHSAVLHSPRNVLDAVP